MRRIVTLLVALVVPASAPAQAAPAPDARHAINAANAAWARLTAGGHSDSLAEFYHPNAVVYPPNMTSLHGKVAIGEFFAAMNHMSSPPPVLTLRADSVWSAGSWAMELGRWNWVWPAGTKLPPGETQADSGKYMVRWVYEKGRWLIMQDTWSSDVLPRPPQQK